jgi:SAM-dependent methyltransferase
MSVVFKWNQNDFQKLIDNCASEPVTPFILKYIPKTGKVLEAGCGSGRFVYYLHQLGYHITGIEIGEETVKLLNSLFPSLDIRVGDVRSMPFPDESFDSIISLGVIEHVIEGIDGPIREMYRVLKPDSYAIVIVPSFNPIRRVKYWIGIQHVQAFFLAMKQVNFIRMLFGKPVITKKGRTVRPSRQYKRWPIFGEFFEYRFTKEEFEKELKQGGFHVVESVPVSLIDGVYHEFGRMFVKLRDHNFYPNALGRWVNTTLSKTPFLHNHMHLCIVKKPRTTEFTSS